MGGVAAALEVFGCRSMPYAESVDCFSRQLRALEKETLSQKSSKYHHHHNGNGNGNGNGTGNGNGNGSAGRRSGAF